MPKKDINQLAKYIVDLATGDEPRRPNGKIVEHAIKGGKAGGKARAEKLSPEIRKEIAKKAANKRWRNK